MRRTKPPVGWEHVKNCFPVPNELLEFDLPAGAIAVYIYLLRHADRRTGQCHPSAATIAKKLHLCRNTVANHVRLLENLGLIVTENTEIITKKGKEIEAEIFRQMGRGVTEWASVGAYTGQGSTMLYVLMSKYEIAQLRGLAKKIDPSAFIVISSDVRVYGNFLKKM